MKDHEIANLVSSIAKAAEEFTGTQQLRQVVSNLVVPALKTEQGELEALRAENERLKFAMKVPAYCEDNQEWAGIDGAIAFHMVERHGENWAHCGKLMDAWRNANPPGLALYGWLEAESSCNGAKPENMVGNASLIHSTRMHLSIHAPQKAVTTNPLFPVFIGPQRS